MTFSGEEKRDEGRCFVCGDFFSNSSQLVCEWFLPIECKECKNVNEREEL